MLRSLLIAKFPEADTKIVPLGAKLICMAPLFLGWLGRQHAVQVPGGQEEGASGTKSSSKQIKEHFLGLWKYLYGADTP